MMKREEAENIVYDLIDAVRWDEFFNRRDYREHLKEQRERVIKLVMQATEEDNVNVGVG